MKFLKGLYTDCSETDMPEGTYRHAKNIVDSNVLGAKENEDGFIDCGEQAPYTPIGIIVCERDFVVFSTDNTDSEIGLVTRSGSVLTYATIYSNPDLGFSTESPIKGEFRKDVNGNRVIVWIDDINVPRILNIDDTSGVNDVEDLAIFQDVENPAMYFSTVNDAGGALQTSALTLITKYKNRDGSETNWFVHDHMFYINEDSKSLAFNENDGAVAGVITNKSITAYLSGCDTRYDTIVIGYIQVINGIARAYQAFSTTNASSITTTITGNESTSDVSLDEILTPTTNYLTAGAITQLAGKLYLADLTTDSLPELQGVALNININYNSSLVNVVSNTDSHKDNLPPTFIPGEVYAFYLGVELNKGGWVYYHIPGRPPIGNIFTLNGDISTVVSDGLTYTKYQIDNTSNRGSDGAMTNMGYWENQNEIYPSTSTFNNGTIDLRGQKVRHHRMPTFDYLTGTTYSATSTVGVTELIRLGIDVTGVIIPAEVQSKIKRWKIFYAKKTDGNSLFVGSDLLQVGVNTAADSSVRWGTGGNWSIVPLGGTPAWAGTGAAALSADTIRGHCADLLIGGNNITPTYARFPFKLSRNAVNTSYSGFRGTGGSLTITGNSRGENASVVIDYTVPAATTRSGSGFVKRLDNFKYLPANALDGKFKTQYTEGVFVADVYTPGTSFNSITYGAMFTRAGNTSGVDNQLQTNGTEETMHMQYFRLLTDTHVSFTQQTLIPTESYATPTSTSLSVIYGGNGFLCFISYLACGPLNTNPDATLGNSFEAGIRAWKAYVGYSKYNLNYRYQTSGDASTNYYGKTDVRDLFVPSRRISLPNVDHDILFTLDQGVNNIQYNTDYNTMNEYIVGVIWNEDIVQETEFPNTVIWSATQNEDSKEFSWRSFLAGDKYVIPKHKGSIVNIQGVRNKELLIQTEFALFKTRTDIQVGADSDDIFFKSASVFSLPPEDQVPATTGYVGTQNKFSCNLTKAGYVSVDDLQGKIFLHDGTGSQEISTNGMRAFFRDFMNIGTLNEDNPFTSTGYNVAFDERNNRLLVSKKFDNLSWTISYNPTNRTWVSYHDYVPDYMFSTVDNILYGIKDDKFYIQNIPGSAKGVFYNSTVNPSFIEASKNIGSDAEFVSASWLSESYVNTYVTGQPSSSLDYTNTLTHLTLRTPDRCTGRIQLSLNNYMDSLYSSNIRVLNRTWYYNDIRDIAIASGFVGGFYNNYAIDTAKLNTNMEWYDTRRFIDKFIICRFEYDNVINQRFLFLEGDIQYRDVKR